MGPSRRRKLLREASSDPELRYRAARHKGRRSNGSREFIRDLERRTGRRLRVLDRGRQKAIRQSPEDRAGQIGPFDQ